MKSSSTRRVLKSVVGPALGATLGAMIASGCAKEEAKPAPTTTLPEPAKPEPTKAEPEPVKPEAATAVEPEPPAATIDAGAVEAKPVPKKPAPKKAVVKDAPAGEPAKEVAPPKKEAPKKDSPSTEWYAGTFLDRDIRPMRPARRGTDATLHALMTGLHGASSRPLG